MGFSPPLPVLAHTVLGPDGAAPLLFVHGFPVDSRMWSAAAERLAGASRCILPDLRGFGRTPPEPEQSIAAHADDLAALLREIGERRPVTVVGLSMGGIIAFEFFRRYRPMVAAIILVCTRANAETPEGVAKRGAIAEGVLAAGVRGLADTMIGTVLAPGAPRAVRESLYGMMLDQPALGVAAGSRALGGRRESFSTLDAIDVPTLCIAGEEDSITPVELMKAMHEKIRGSRLAVIPASGHVPPMEKTQEFVDVVAGFVAQRPAAAEQPEVR